MRDLTNIGYVLRGDGVPWSHDPGSYREVKEIPPAPPWIHRSREVSPWREWMWDPIFTSILFVMGLGIVFLPLGLLSTATPWGLLWLPICILITISPIITTKMAIKRNTKLYEIHTLYSRHYIEASVIGDSNMRARIIVVDRPIRIEL